MKKVLLINPRVDYRPQPPLGLAYIAAALEAKGYEVRVYDPTRGHEEGAFTELFREFRPDAVGITCLTPQEEKLYYFAALVKRLDAAVPVVTGGVHPTAVPRKVLSSRDIDVAVIGEGERTVVNLVDALGSGAPLSGVRGIAYKEGEKISITPPAELAGDPDSLPWPARHLLDMRWYSRRLSLIRGKWLRCTTIIAIRGCPYDCIFCSSNKIFGRRVRFRSPAKVVEEIKSLVNEHALEAVLFADDTFTLSKPWLLELCGLLRKEVPGIIWNCQARVGSLDDDMLKAMTDSGCIQVEFGIESGSPKVLRALKKMQTPEDIKETFRLCKKYPIRAMANFIIGNPEETLDDIEMTSSLAREIKADYTEFFILTPYPGTKLYEMAERNGWILKGDAFYGRESNRPVMSINFKPDELVSLRKKLYEENLNSIWKSYLLDPRFILDVLKFTFSRPSVIPGYAAVLWREKSLAELGRHINTEMSMHYMPPPPRSGREAGA